jgi:transposase
MPFPRKRKALQFTELELRKLESIRRSRTEEKRRTVRAAVLLDSLSGQSDDSIARRHHVGRSTVVLCIQKCLHFGLDAALGELPRTGKPRQLPDDAIAWVLNCACQKPKELGYSYELWTYKLLTAHVRRQCIAAGHPALQKLSRSKLLKSCARANFVHTRSDTTWSGGIRPLRPKWRMYCMSTRRLKSSMSIGGVRQTR